MVPRREGDKVGIGVGGGDRLTAVGGTVGGGGVSRKGRSVCSGLGGKVGVGVGGAVTVGMAVVDGGDGHGGKVRKRVNQRTSTKFEIGNKSCEGKRFTNLFSKMAVEG